MKTSTTVEIEVEFNLEIDKLADEYELGIGKKGYILDIIWEYCNQVHNKNYGWHDHEFENKERKELGIEEDDYHPPEVQVETFEVKKYSFEGGQSFDCVSKDLNNVLPLGRKNGSKFKEMIQKEVENNKTLNGMSLSMDIKEMDKRKDKTERNQAREWNERMRVHNNSNEVTRVLRGFLLHRSSINNSASLSNKFGESYFIFKFRISGLLHQVITAIADRIRGCLSKILQRKGNALFGFQDLCLRQELLEYMCVHNNDASESSQPSWGRMCTSGT
ncbi:hypothetical protein Tco_0139242 [Tanacetum coccineum]